jgi:hypothetical protein
LGYTRLADEVKEAPLEASPEVVIRVLKSVDAKREDVWRTVYVSAIARSTVANGCLARTPSAREYAMYALRMAKRKPSTASLPKAWASLSQEQRDVIRKRIKRHVERHDGEHSLLPKTYNVLMANDGVRASVEVKTRKVAEHRESCGACGAWCPACARVRGIVPSEKPSEGLDAANLRFADGVEVYRTTKQ